MGDFEAQAADKIIKIALDGTEYALHLTAKTASKSGAFLLALGRVARDENHSKGAQTLKTMLKSGKELSVFSVAPADLKNFTKEAKRYGITFCAVKSKDDVSAPIDLLVRTEDAGRINRIVERLECGAVKDGDVIGENPMKGRSEPIKNREAQFSPFYAEDRPSVLDRLKDLAGERKQQQAPYRTRHRTKDLSL